ITATNVSGSDTATVTITIESAAPMLETPAAQIYTSGEEIASLTLINPSTAGQLNDLDGCTVNPALPANLTLARSDNTHTCVISGTPTEAQGATNYVITATNVTGSNSTTVSIEILNGAPEFATPTPATINFGDVPTQSYVNTNTAGAAVTTCAANDLPQGLTIAAIPDPGGDENFRGGCALGGSPTEIVAAADYDITVTNTNGTATLTLNITINLAIPMPVVPVAQVYTSGEEIASLTLINSPNAGQLNDLDGCTVNPALPANLTLARSDNTHTCVISGTPTEAQGATDYVITATNTSGSNTATVSIEILNGAPEFATPTPVIIAVGDTLTQTYVNINTAGAAVTACVATNLPADLTITAIAGGGGGFRGGCTLSGSPT
nr:hypothetical protein [Pseudomonadota bacterium]